MSDGKSKPKGAADSAMDRPEHVPDENRFVWTTLAGATFEPSEDENAEDLFTEEDLADLLGKGE